jgi:hypothetical protein
MPSLLASYNFPIKEGGQPLLYNISKQFTSKYSRYVYTGDIIIEGRRSDHTHEIMKSFSRHKDYQLTLDNKKKNTIIYGMAKTFPGQQNLNSYIMYRIQ